MPVLTLRPAARPGARARRSGRQPHLAALAQHFTVINHDHRGAGQSSIARIDYSVEQMADDVLQSLDHLELERTHFMGHSTGGAIGQILALDHPERIDRLVLSATWPKAAPYFDLLFEVRARVLCELGAAAYLTSNALLLMPPFWLRDHADEVVIDAPEAARRMPDPGVVLRRIEAIRRFDRRAELHRIRTPTLVIGARDDVVTPAYFTTDIGQLIPDAQTVILPQGGYFFPRIHPRQFRSIVLDFLGVDEDQNPSSGKEVGTQ